MKKTRKVLALVLVFAMLLSMSAFATGASSAVKNVHKPETDRFGVALLAELIREDSATRESSLSGNILTYVLKDGTSGTIVESDISPDVFRLDIMEGEKHDSILIDICTGSMHLNGKTVGIVRSVAPLQSTTITSRGNTWHLLGTSYPDVYAEECIKDMATASLLTIISGVMFIAHNVVSITVGVVQEIIGTAIAINSSTRYVYATRNMYYYGDYVVFKCVDDYYLNSARTQYAFTHTIEYLGGN